MPASNFIMGKLQKILKNVMSLKDKRLKLFNQILSGIKALKLYAWESSFDDKISQYREEEIKCLNTRAYWNGAMVFVFVFAPTLVCLAKFPFNDSFCL